MSSYEPVLSGGGQSNVYDEVTYRVRATFGASSAVTYRSKDAVIAKSTTAVWTITLPKPYAEITGFHVGQKAAINIIPLEYTITTNAVATTGIITITAKETAASGAATEPGTGDVAYFTICVSCNPLNDKFTG